MPPNAAADIFVPTVVKISFTISANPAAAGITSPVEASFVFGSVLIGGSGFFLSLSSEILR